MGAHHRIDPADVFVTRVRVRVVVVCCCVAAAVAIVLTRIVDVSVAPHAKPPTVAGASTVDASPGTDQTDDADSGGAASAAPDATDAPGAGGGAGGGGAGGGGAGGTGDNQPAPAPGPLVTTGPAGPVAIPTRAGSPTPTPSPTPPLVRVVSYEAESSRNTLPGTRVYACAPCSGGKKVGYVGDGAGYLQFNRVNAVQAGTVTLSIAYVNGDPTSRRAQLSVDGGSPVWLTFAPTGDWNTVRTLTVKVGLRAGDNTVKLANPTEMAPDFDRLTVRETG